MRVSRTLRPAPPPQEANDLVVTSSITAAWAVALVVLIVVRDQLPTADRWWIWVAAFGCFMGLFGLAWVPHIKHSRERASGRRAAAEEDETPSGGSGAG